MTRIERTAQLPARTAAVCVVAYPYVTNLIQKGLTIHQRAFVRDRIREDIRYPANKNVAVVWQHELP